MYKILVISLFFILVGCNNRGASDTDFNSHSIDVSIVSTYVDDTFNMPSFEVEVSDVFGRLFFTDGKIYPLEDAVEDENIIISKEGAIILGAHFFKEVLAFDLDGMYMHVILQPTEFEEPIGARGGIWQLNLNTDENFYCEIPEPVGCDYIEQLLAEHTLFIDGFTGDILRYFKPEMNLMLGLPRDLFYEMEWTAFEALARRTWAKPDDEELTTFFEIVANYGELILEEKLMSIDWGQYPIDEIEWSYYDDLLFNGTLTFWGVSASNRVIELTIDRSTFLLQGFTIL